MGDHLLLLVFYEDVQKLDGFPVHGFEDFAGRFGSSGEGEEVRGHGFAVLGGVDEFFGSLFFLWRERRGFLEEELDCVF